MSYGRGAALLSALIGVTGLLTYAFHSLAAHALGRDGYGVDRRAVGGGLPDRVGDLPAGRAAAVAHDRRAATRRAARSARRCASRPRSSSGWRSLFVAVALALRETDRGRALLGQRDALLVPGRGGASYAASYFARGFLAGQRRFGLYGGLVLMESASRVVFGVLLAVGVLNGENAAGVAIAAAPLLSLFVRAVGARAATCAAGRRAAAGRDADGAGVHARARARLRRAPCS